MLSFPFYALLCLGHDSGFCHLSALSDLLSGSITGAVERRARSPNLAANLAGFVLLFPALTDLWCEWVTHIAKVCGVFWTH
jgi:hypothetical protein